MKGKKQSKPPCSPGTANCTVKVQEKHGKVHCGRTARCVAPACLLLSAGISIASERERTLLPILHSPGSRPKPAAYQRTLRAAPRTVEVTPEGQPRTRPLECRQLVVRRE